ncbi:uncharacterized protein G2W53_028796 [Senna tora]|uniref:Uncharacterized protein n=1 Tax=Senna tora TaxID=362788 RepID=A0A834T435_9FABA|nr:uncharacterized protein G2W53_028796 [Senna tora]
MRLGELPVKSATPTLRTRIYISCPSKVHNHGLRCRIPTRKSQSILTLVCNELSSSECRNTGCTTGLETIAQPGIYASPIPSLWDSGTTGYLPYPGGGQNPSGGSLNQGGMIQPYPYPDHQQPRSMATVLQPPHRATKGYRVIPRKRSPKAFSAMLAVNSTTYNMVIWTIRCGGKFQSSVLLALPFTPHSVVLLGSAAFFVELAVASNHGEGFREPVQQGSLQRALVASNSERGCCHVAARLSG